MAFVSPVEAAAVVLAVLYLVLAIRQQPACWLAGAASAVLYGWLLWHARLYLEAGLQLVYVGLSAYGLWQWRRGAAGATTRAVTRAPAALHLPLLAGVALLTLLTGTALARATDAAWPFVDPALAYASLVATWLTARKWLENWVYWFVIDAASVVVYLERGLLATAGLFALYVVLIVVGYRSWARTLRAVPP